MVGEPAMIGRFVMIGKLAILVFSAAFVLAVTEGCQPDKEEYRMDSTETRERWDYAPAMRDVAKQFTGCLLYTSPSPRD